MAKVYSPNKKYTGVSASVPFAGGVGATDNPHLLEWFRQHGYRVEEAAAVQNPPPSVPPQDPPPDEGGNTTPGGEGNTPAPDFAKMGLEDLQAYAKEKGIDLGGATSENGVRKKITEAEKAAE